MMKKEGNDIDERDGKSAESEKEEVKEVEEEEVEVEEEEEEDAWVRVRLPKLAELLPLPASLLRTLLTDGMSLSVFVRARE